MQLRGIDNSNNATLFLAASINIDSKQMACGGLYAGKLGKKRANI